MRKLEALISRKFIIYKHVCPDGKMYIGQTCKKFEFRCGRNGINYKKCIAFYRAIQKYGWDNIEHTIICSGLTPDEADWVEQYLIAFYQTHNPKYGYNLTLGGQFKRNGVSLETREKLRISHLGVKHTPEQIEKIRLGNIGKHQDAVRNLRPNPKGENSNWYGRHHTEATKRLLAEQRIGKKQDVELARRLAEHRRILFATPEMRAKFRVAQHPKRVVCIETGEEFECISAVSEIKKISSSHLRRCCKDQTKTAKGYHWKYVEDVAS